MLFESRKGGRVQDNVKQYETVFSFKVSLFIHYVFSPKNKESLLIVLI